MPRANPPPKSVPSAFTVTPTQNTDADVPAEHAIHPPEPGPGRVYIVQPGDSLAKIAIAQYNNFNLYRQILAATNAMAAQDGSFAPIVDPAKLRVGQKLWLPDQP